MRKHIFYPIFALVILISLAYINEHKRIAANNTISAKFINNTSEVKNIKVIAHRGLCLGGPENSLGN